MTLKLKSAVIVMFILSHLYAQKEAVTDLKIGEIRTLTSEILNEERTLNIYLPRDYDASQSYPVLYLLDGSIDEDFLHITGLLQFFKLQFQMPDFMVVGIANVDRKRDFTFHTELEDLQKTYPTTGHSQNFIEFLEKELIPYIEKNFKTSQTRYLIGQSLGGLLATEILFKKPYLFTHYLIVSPSLWWDDESLLRQSPVTPIAIDPKIYVDISVGKGEHPIMKKDAEALKEILEKKDQFDVHFRVMKDENHATILHNSIYAALVELFPYREEK